MTVLDDQELVAWGLLGGRPARPGECRADRPPRTRPTPTRPALAPLGHRGAGVKVSRAARSHRPAGASASVGLACLAALVTLWLGALAHLSGARPAIPAADLGQLAVVRVQSGETLAHIASRVAPGAPVGQVVERIRELNKLDSAALDVGQTLIAPIG